jgi:hypothetical protein
MRALSPVVALFVVFAAAALTACQDSHASDAERDTHMGDVHAVAAASYAPQSPFGALPPAGAGADMAVAPVAATVSDAGLAKDASARPAHRHPMP